MIERGSVGEGERGRMTVKGIMGWTVSLSGKVPRMGIYMSFSELVFHTDEVKHF